MLLGARPQGESSVGHQGSPGQAPTRFVHSAVTVISDTNPTHEGHRAAPGVQTQAFLSEEERILALPES